MRRIIRKDVGLVGRGMGWLTVGAILLATAQPAFALTDEERSGARAAATSGEKAFEEKRWSDAIDMFRRAEAIIHSPVHLLFIAKSQVELGQLVQARESFIKVVNEDVPPGAPAALSQSKQEAERELEKLEPRLAYVSVVVQGESPDPVVVKMDGHTVPPTLVGVPRPVNPGEHKFEAASASMESNVTTVSVKEGTKETVVITLRPAAKGQAPAPAGGAAPAEDTGGSRPEADGGGGPSGLAIGGYVGLGVGALGLGLGTAFVIIGNGDLAEADDLNADCAPRPSGCTDDEINEINALDSDADSARGIGTVGLIIGGAGIATGVTLLILNATKSHDSAEAPKVLPYVGLTSAGVVGRF